MVPVSEHANAFYVIVMVSHDSLHLPSLDMKLSAESIQVLLAVVSPIRSQEMVPVHVKLLPI